jgi:hypothetical protein
MNNQKEPTPPALEEIYEKVEFHFSEESLEYSLSQVLRTCNLANGSDVNKCRTYAEYMYGELLPQIAQLITYLREENKRKDEENETLKICFLNLATHPESPNWLKKYCKQIISEVSPLNTPSPFPND